MFQTCQNGANCSWLTRVVLPGGMRLLNASTPPSCRPIKKAPTIKITATMIAIAVLPFIEYLSIVYSFQQARDVWTSILVHNVRAPLKESTLYYLKRAVNKQPRP